jgi:hypothetical protein
MYLKDIAAAREKSRQLEGIRPVEFYNQCHDDDGEFCSSGWKQSLEQAKEYVDHNGKYWLTRDGLFAPVREYHSEVFPEGAGESSGQLLQANYALFAKKQRAVRIDVDDRSANVEVWQPITDDQFAAVAGNLQRSSVYISSHGRYGGTHDQVLYQPSYTDLDSAMDIASRHAAGEEISESARYLSDEEKIEFATNARMSGKR